MCNAEWPDESKQNTWVNLDIYQWKWCGLSVGIEGLNMTVLDK